MGFDVHVRDMTTAAERLGAATPPTLDAGGAPNVGATPGAVGYAADYAVWTETRTQDLLAADTQTDAIVAKIKEAARNYRDTDDDASQVYLKALDNALGRIDR